MSDTAPLGFPEAARRLGVPVRVLRHAIRMGKIPAPPTVTATTTLPADWLAKAQGAVETSPKALARTFPQKVPPFARYHGTSAWRDYPARVREFAAYRASTTGS